MLFAGGRFDPGKEAGLLNALWATDIHLNFLSDHGRAAFLDFLNDQKVDAFWLTGDIGESPSVIPYLEELADRLARPIHFVLGNHDFYRGSIAEVRQTVANLCEESPILSWMPIAGVHSLSETTALVGHDGWADARHGDYDSSELMLTDFILIKELTGLNKRERLERLQSLAADSALHLGATLEAACREHQNIYLLTHVPPFRESCSTEGRIWNTDWLPFFTNKAAGDAILEVMAHWPDRSLTVLCGHTHRAGDVHIGPNIHVLTGAAEYRSPAIQQVFEIE